MAQRKKTTKSRIAPQKKATFAPRAWMAVALIAAVAVVGIVVLRLSQASGTTGSMYAAGSNAQVCTINPNSHSLHVCGGNFVPTADGVAWRTSVNQLGAWQWFGPYEKLTVWPDSSAKSVRACVSLRDNVPFGVRAEYVFDIVSAQGTPQAKTLGTRTIRGQEGAFKTSANSVSVQCVTANLDQAQTYPYDLNNVEYRIRVLRGSVDILQMARTMVGTVSSSEPLALARPDYIWPVLPDQGIVRGANEAPGGGCWRQSRASGAHTGVDIYAADGAPVIAAKAGTVINVNSPADPAGYGNFIVINHHNGQYTLYGHIKDVAVQPGQNVAQGQQIAAVGSTGNAAGLAPQVHFQVQTAYNNSANVNINQTINPLTILPQDRALNGCAL